MLAQLVADHQHKQQFVWSLINTFSKNLKPGLTEPETFAALSHFLKENKADKIWHPTVLKFDESTLNTTVKHTPVANRTLRDIAIVDLGVVIDNLEIDCGNSFAFSSEAQKLVDAMHEVFNVTKQKLLADWRTTAPAAMYEFVCEQARQRGFTQLAPSVGHLVGPYPTPKREVKMMTTCEATTFPAGWWMVEIYLGDGVRGAFFEDCVYLT